MYVLKYSAAIEWVGEGTGPMTVPDAQRYRVQQTTPVQVAIGGSLTQTTINNAITGAMTTDLETQFAAGLGQMQQWPNGGG